MTTATRLVPYSQWRLMNLIAAHPNHAAKALMAAADADLNDVLVLEQAEYLTVDVEGTPISATLMMPMFLAKGSTKFRLTAAGRDWVRTNPRNKVLTALVKKSNHRAPLRRVAQEVDVDPDVFFALEDAGLVVVTASSSGPVWKLAVEMFRQRSDFIWVQLTRKGRELAGAAS